MSASPPDQPRRARGGKRAAERKPSRWRAGGRTSLRKGNPSPGLALIAGMDLPTAPARSAAPEGAASPVDTTPSTPVVPEPVVPEPVAPEPVAPDPVAPEPEPTSTPEPRPLPSPLDQGHPDDALAEVAVKMPATGPSKPLITVWLVIALGGTVALVANGLALGPPWLDGAGAVAVVTALTWFLAARTAGRALIAAALACTLGVGAVVVGGTVLPTGAAVMTAAVGGVYAVMATVPAPTWWKAVREVLIATFIAGITALAAVGFEPTVSTTRFDLTTLIIALVLCGAVVHRLGAGLHGLGRRGLMVVTLGAIVLIATLAYAEVLRRYGSLDVVASVLDFVEVVRDRIGAFPRPLVVLLGIPALVWGTYLRARRRQGWWVCMFGVAATVPFASGLVPPDDTFVEATLRAAYSLALGLPLGWLVIRADLALSGSRRSRGRRADATRELRPEPSRFGEL
ncbi:MAG: hypothetical protein LT071_01495 [Nocardioides sp.]|nr:hypothetical protein [Nocardioides sp.]